MKIQRKNIKVLIFNSIPDGTYLRQLKGEDSESCNTFYEYKNSTSVALIESLILINGGYGLFSIESNELLSFALINDHFAIGMLYTVVNARGKKYGEFIAKLLSLKIAQDFQVSPICFVHPSNTASNKLFVKLGYKIIGNCNWVEIDNNERSSA